MTDRVDLDELKAILDRHAGKVHSNDGPVMAALREILDRHAEMLGIPRQLTQARNPAGLPWWWHPCGDVLGSDSRPLLCLDCDDPGPWRPLHVGGDPAPEHDPGRCPTCDSPQPSMHPAVSGGGEVIGICSDGFHAPRQPSAPDFLAAVNTLTIEREDWKRRFHEQAARGDEDGQIILTLRRQLSDARAELAHHLESVDRLAGELNGARAEVERLNIAVSQEIEARDENADWADRLANAIAEFLHIDIGEHSNMNLPRQAALIALTDAVSPPQQDGPRTLTLPEVPEGAVALIGVEGGRRYARGTDSRGETIWAEGIIGGMLGEVLDNEPKGVRVEMDPPREPRTWPKLDGAAHDVVKVQGARHLWHRDGGHQHHGHDSWYTDDSPDVPRDIPLVDVQCLDGPLTEILDDRP